VRTAGVMLGGEARIESPPTANLQSYDLYLRARHLTNSSNEDSIRLALGLYEQAIGLDSSFALAWSGMAWTWNVLADTWIPAREAFPHARVAAEKALALDSTVAEAHLQLAAINLFHDWNIPTARIALANALRLNPGSTDLRAMRGLRLLLSKSTDSAVTELHGALARDPFNSATTFWTIYALQAAERDSQAIAVAHRYGSLATPGDAGAALALCAAYAGAGDFARMRDAAIAASARGAAARAYLGYAEGRLGNRAAALRIARELERSPRWVNPSSIALVYAGLGDADKAMPWLEKAMVDRTADVTFLWLPIWDPIRSDARFREIQRKVAGA
jgi:serine/threonine-protein kinase